MKELPKCDVDGCEKNARSLKGGYCLMHYTRWRNHGDTSVNLYEWRGKSSWELPDGTIISEGRKIKNLNIIIERIKNKRLLGYQKHDDTLDIIEKVLDDSHGKYKSGKVKRGMKTLTYEKYVDVLANSDWGFEEGLITITQAELVSKVVSELSKNRGAIKFWNICKNLEIGFDKNEWLIKLFTKHLIIGITYNPDEKTIEFSKTINQFYDEFNKESNHGATLDNNYAIESGFHYERIKSYNEHDEFKSDQYDYSILVTIAVEKVVKYLIENGDTEEKILYEKCNTNQIMLQQMIDNDIGIIKNNGIVKFSLVQKIQELIKKEKEMEDSLTSEEGLTYKKILSNLGINYVEYATLEAVKKNRPELV